MQLHATTPIPPAHTHCSPACNGLGCVCVCSCFGSGGVSTRRLQDCPPPHSSPLWLLLTPSPSPLPQTHLLPPPHTSPGPLPPHTYTQVCRTTLLPSALKTLAANKGEPLPLRLFELSDVVLLDAGRDVGARNERRLLAVTCGKSSEFDAVHGLLNRVMQVLGVPHACREIVRGMHAKCMHCS